MQGHLHNVFKSLIDLFAACAAAYGAPLTRD